MDAALSCARPSKQDELPSFRVWMNAGASPGFAFRRLAVMALNVFALALACLVARCPYLLPLALFCGTWPLPFHCRVGRGVLEVRWLFLRHAVPLEEIEAWGLVVDPRRWVLGRRRRVLSITRRGESPVLLFASARVLGALAGELQRNLR